MKTTQQQCGIKKQHSLTLNDRDILNLSDSKHLFSQVKINQILQLYKNVNNSIFSPINLPRIKIIHNFYLNFTQPFIMVKKQKQEYVVKEIIDRKDEVSPKGATITYYKVLWEGYPESQATWESARKLSQHPQLKKDIKNFNLKHKTIQKIKQNLTVNKNLTENVAQNKPQQKPTPKPIQSKNKKNPIQIQKKPQPKVIKNRTPVTHKTIDLDKNKEPKKGADPQNNGNAVVEKILQKMRQNVNNKVKQSKNNDIIQEKSKQVPEKIVSRPKPIPKNKKAPQKQLKTVRETKDKNKNILAQVTSTPHKQDVGKQKEPLLSDLIPSISFDEKDTMLTTSCVNRIIDQIIEEKTSFSKQIQSVVDSKLNVNENIKLQLTEEEISHHGVISGNMKSKQLGNEPIITNEEQFEIKGMMMCKNEYFYLVQENGKSQIMSRAEILNTHPYELICFYERRINIKPAEINMMIL